MTRILIVEDDKKIREELKIYLENNQYEVRLVTDFQDVLTQMENTECDLILLDLALPNITGEKLCCDYRYHHSTPIIIVTSQNNEMTELMCMKMGADDFVVKPYNPLILMARIDAVLKRSTSKSIIEYLDLVIDISKSIITCRDQSVELTKNELRILAFLINNHGSIKSREEIMAYLWDSDMFVDDNTLTVNINRLRNKLKDLGYEDLIHTKRGQGYLIE